MAKNSHFQIWGLKKSQKLHSSKNFHTVVFSIHQRNIYAKFQLNWLKIESSWIFAFFKKHGIFQENHCKTLVTVRIYDLESKSYCLMIFCQICHFFRAQHKKKLKIAQKYLTFCGANFKLLKIMKSMITFWKLEKQGYNISKF